MSEVMDPVNPGQFCEISALASLSAFVSRALSGFRRSNFGFFKWYRGCLESVQCEQRGIMNDHNFAHPTASIITVEVKSPTITLPECVRPNV